MLILSRYIGEKIIIKDNIEVVVVAIKGRSVRFGFNAPRDVEIHREEIYQRIQKERQNMEGE